MGGGGGGGGGVLNIDLFHFSSQSNFGNVFTRTIPIQFGLILHVYATNFLLENLFIYMFHKLIFPSGSVFIGGFSSACKMDVVNSICISMIGNVRE